MDYEVDIKPRGRPKITWKVVDNKGLTIRHLNMVMQMQYKWRRLLNRNQTESGV